MRTLNGYRMLVIASRTRRTANVVWHYSTGNDDTLCGKGVGENGTGYVNTEDLTTYKGCCQACARYVGKHGDYQGWDSVNEVRYLSITNPKPMPELIMHYGAMSAHCGNKSRRITSFIPNVNCPTCIDVIETPQDELWNAEEIPRGWEDATHSPRTDFDAAMSFPIVHYRGKSKALAMLTLHDTLCEHAEYDHIVRSGQDVDYLTAASHIIHGVAHVTLGGRHYRIRKGVHVNQTRGKGL